MDDLLTPDNLPVRFQGTDRDGLPALDDVSLTIRRGQFLVVVGPSGYGKSTPPRAVARLILGTSGSVTRDPATGQQRRHRDGFPGSFPHALALRARNITAATSRWALIHGYSSLHPELAHEQ